jgi:hypothetical protein
MKICNNINQNRVIFTNKPFIILSKIIFNKLVMANDKVDLRNSGHLLESFMMPVRITNLYHVK